MPLVAFVIKVDCEVDNYKKDDTMCIFTKVEKPYVIIIFFKGRMGWAMGYIRVK